MGFSIKHRFIIFISMTFIEIVTLHSNLLLCWHGFRDVNITVKDLLFIMSNNPTRGHPLKIFKKRYRLRVRGHFFSNRIVDGWNDLPTEVVTAPSLNLFKSRLNKCWKGHPYKSEPWCYTPGERTRWRNFQNASTEVFGPELTSTL